MMQSYLTVFSATTLASVLLIKTQHWHGRFSLDGTQGVQKHHTTPTPRIGGIAVMAGLMLAWQLAPLVVRGLLGPLLLAAIPAFALGLLEDLTKKVSVSARLLATVFSGALACYLTGVTMQDTGLPPLDWLLSFTPFAVLFTAIAVGGVANSVNIIDGFNGLASGAVAIMLGAMGLISLSVGDLPLAVVCGVVAASALGFGAVNWLTGKLFLGDGGAYLLGFALAWVAVLLPMRHTEINAWATLLVCAYPVLEVGFSVRRRRRRIGHHPGQADKVHLHHLIHRRIVCKLFVNANAHHKNSLTSPFCWLATTLPAGWAVVFAQDTYLLALGFGLVMLTYAALYARITQFHWCFSARTMQARPLKSTH
jgi:UDP-N-acetylmuramyl pentapeptide phosphotransferase/UDP-N-acetylglucosamine-1-phosphate transferase